MTAIHVSKLSELIAAELQQTGLGPLGERVARALLALVAEELAKVSRDPLTDLITEVTVSDASGAMLARLTPARDPATDLIESVRIERFDAGLH